MSTPKNLNFFIQSTQCNWPWFLIHENLIWCGRASDCSSKAEASRDGKNGLLTFFTDNNKYRTADFVQSNNFWVGLRIFAWLRYLCPVKLSRYKMFLCRPIFATESTSALTTTSMQCIWILVRLGKINNETPRHGVAQFVLHEESTISPSVFVRDFTPWQLTFVGCYLRFSHDCHVEQKMLFSWKNKLPASR